ncbi:MAG TPA: efflux RND transporter periplasmic adaptor subunit [Pyrinomonadaceae bacterium]|nr:efflux RND transporter periplasmic adaptor subunit [Pyrinomonadaceae bacterium]
MRRLRLIAAILSILAVAGLLVFAFARNGFRKQTTVPGKSETKKETNAREEIVLACPGRVEGQSEVINVGAGADGVLTAVLVHEGQQVRAGQVIALIDCREIESQIDEARALADRARQNRLRLLRGSRPEERSKAADETAVAEAQFKQAQLQHQRVAQLFKSAVVSKEELDQAARDLAVAEATLNATKNQQALVNAPPLPEELARADSEVGLAQEQARTAKARLDKCTVKAPLSGTILRTFLKAGESVSTVFPQPIVSLADTSQIRVRAEVDERDVGRVYVGQSVIVLADAYPEKRFTGKVSRVGAAMGRKKVRTGDPAEKSDRDVLEVLIDLEGTEESLVVGLRTSVQFLNH